MTLTQNWVGYLDRSYEQIKRSCLSRLGVLAPEISDHSESNPLIIILSMFSGIGEMLNLYIDSAARETFLGTARRYASVVKLSRLIDYNIKAKNPASVNLKFFLTDQTSGLPINLPSGQLLIPAGTVVNSINGGIPFVVDRDIRILSGNQNVFGSASQYQNVVGDILGTTNGLTNQTLDLPDDYVEGSLKLTIAGEEWTLYRSQGLMFSNTKGYIINIDEDQKAFVQFGDDINGKIPLVSSTVFATYKVSVGATGNVPPDQITEIVNTIPTPSNIVLNVTNPDYASGGTDFETIEDIRNRAPRSIRTLERAVTYQDYLDLAYLVLGVGAAEVSYCCGKFVDIYIAPNSPGAATQSLLQSVTDYINCRKMITTQIAVKAAGISKIWIKATIKGKPLLIESDIYNAVVDKLDAEFGYSKLQINRRVSIIDIISALQSLPEVDNVIIEEVRIKPFPRPINQTVNPLNITFNSLPNTTTPFKYTIRYNAGLSKFVILKGTFNVGEKAIGETYADDVISFTFDAGTYINNDSWEFTAFPSYPNITPQNIIEITDFSAAIIEVGPFIDADTPRTIYSDLTIQTQVAYTNCLPPC